MDKQELENIIGKVYDYYWEMQEEIDKENTDFGKIDLLCRQTQADITTLKEMTWEIRQNILKGPIK